MELQIADSTFTPYDVIDTYESCIWTERYAAHGDFKLKVKKLNQLSGSLHLNPRYLLSSEGQNIMMVENVETKREDNGEPYYEVSGRSLEAFLMERTNTTQGNPPIPFVDSIPNIVKYIFEFYILNNANPDNRLPGVTLGWFPTDRPVVDITVGRGNLYSVIQSLCVEYGFGFRFQRGFYNGVADLTFTMLDGLDRTNPDSEMYMEYSQDMENLIDVSTLTSIAKHKNYARVEGARQTVEVYARGVPYRIEGWNRRVLVVNAGNVGTDKERPLSEDIPILRSMGYKALAEAREITLIDGEIPSAAWNKIHYGLGDIVMVKDQQGVRSKMRITEQIFSSDINGHKRTPTFTVYEGVQY